MYECIGFYVNGSNPFALILKNNKKSSSFDLEFKFILCEGIRIPSIILNDI